MMRKKTLGTLLLWATTFSTTVLAQQEMTHVQLPDGEARAIIEGACIACHELDYIPDSRGYSHEDWDALISSMIALPDEMNDPVVGYLAENFPKKPIEFLKDRVWVF